MCTSLKEFESCVVEYKSVCEERQCPCYEVVYNHLFTFLIWNDAEVMFAVFFFNSVLTMILPKYVNKIKNIQIKIT